MFAKRVSPDQKLREFKTTIRRGVRGIEREMNRMKRREATLKAEMKRCAARGDQASMLILAKDIVQNRNAMRAFMRLSSQLNSMQMRIEIIKAQSGAQTALKGATIAMHQLNKMVNLPQMQMIMGKFMQENMKMDMMGEMTGEMMDDLWDDEGTMDADAAEQYSTIFTEMGIPMPMEISQAMNVPAARATAL